MQKLHPRERAAVLTALVLVQVFFGLHYLAAKWVMREIPPRAWATIRATAAALLLLGVAVVLRRNLPRSRSDLARLAVLAVFGVVINQVCFVEGLFRTTPTHSSLLNTTIPVWTLLLAVILGREPLEPRRLSALVVSLAGVLLVIRPDASAWESGLLAGDLLTLANGVSYAVFLVLSKRLLMRTDAVGATALLLTFGAIGVLPLGLPQLAALDPGQVAPATWALGAFIVLFPTVGAYLLNNWALARVESSTVALFIYLQPLLAASLSAARFGERPSWSTYMGGMLIFSGVFLAVRPAVGPEAVDEALTADGQAPLLAEGKRSRSQGDPRQ